MLPFQVVRDATLSSIEALLFRFKTRPDVAIMLAPKDQHGTGLVTDTNQFFQDNERFAVVDSFVYEQGDQIDRAAWLDIAVRQVGEKLTVIPTYDPELADAIRAHKEGVNVKVYDMRDPQKIPTRCLQSA